MPFIPVERATEEMPEEYSQSILFDIDDLMVCTLTNLIRPELQCIYIDSKGAVTCDFVTACINKTLKSDEPFLLPPEVQQLVKDITCQVQMEGEHICFRASNFDIKIAKPTLSEEPWWEDLRAMVEDVERFQPIGKLQQSVARLNMFGDYIQFTGDKVIADTSYEPFAFTNLGEKRYEIMGLSKILPVVTHIANNESVLVFKNLKSKFLVSAGEEI